MQDELFSHPDGVKILTVADLPQHVRDASRTRLFESRQDTVTVRYESPTIIKKVHIRPYPIDLLLHPNLPVLQRHWRLALFLLDVLGFRMLAFQLGGTRRPSGHDFDVPELGQHSRFVPKRHLDQRAYLVDHVTLWMPALVPHVAIDLDKLLQDGSTAPSTLCRETSRVVEVAVYIPVMLVIRVLGSKQSGTKGTCKMFYMKLLV
jgi:hypothetical protein